MNNRDIAKVRMHRPIPYPAGQWIMKQVWLDLLFAHWPIREEEIAPHLPKELQLEHWEGVPWITLSPFRIEGLRIRGLPPIPLTNRMYELNVRTYVTYKGVPGIYFLSLDASKRLAVETARWFHLPYLKATIDVRNERENIHYSSIREDRRENPAIFVGTYKPIDDIRHNAQPGTQLHWLTERYRMYTSSDEGDLLAIDIHHLPWPLQYAELTVSHNTMAESHKIYLPETAPLLTFTERLDVLIWPIRKV